MSFFFFFQAEDGIRDLYVTGVQTCALPIWRLGEKRFNSLPIRAARTALPGRRTGARSEERRVGKECRSRWSPYPYKKKPKATSSTLYFDSLTVNAGNGGFLHCIQMDTSVNAAIQVVSVGADIFFFFKQKTAYEFST